MTSYPLRFNEQRAEISIYSKRILVSPATLPQHFLARVAQYGSGKVSLRQKEYGIWREFTWQESGQVWDFALGLLALDFRRACEDF